MLEFYCSQCDLHFHDTDQIEPACPACGELPTAECEIAVCDRCEDAAALPVSDYCAPCGAFVAVLDADDSLSCAEAARLLRVAS
jgi:hypothetical protein